MHKIQLLSRVFKWIFQVLILLLPILLCIFWFVPLVQHDWISGSNHFFITFIPQGIAVAYPLSLTSRMYGFLINLIPISVQITLLFFLIKLFSMFERCQIFTRSVVRCIRSIGIIIFIGQLLNVLYNTLMQVFLDSKTLGGHHLVTISISGTNLGMLLIAGFIILISWIMSEAQHIHDEHQFTI